MTKRNRTREAARLGAANATPLPDGSISHAATSNRRAAIPAGVRRITAPDEATALAALLLDPGRRHPVAVVSIPTGRDEPWIDADEIAQGTQSIAEVIVLPTDESSWRLSASLPEMTQVYGGAGRVYPPGLEWTTDPYRSPLRFAYGPADAVRATDALISDALRMGAATRIVADESTSIPAGGIVQMIVPPSRALVGLGDSTFATIWQELTAADVPLERLLAKGMTVNGLLDPETHRLDVTGSRIVGADALADYDTGDVVLASVRDVKPDVVRLALHPDVHVEVPRDRVTSNPQDSLTSLFTPGETVVARISLRDGERFVLRFDDIDDEDEAIPAPALLPGGPPWLVPPAVPDLLPPVADDLPVEARMAAPEPGRPPTPSLKPGAARSLSLTLDAARAELVRLEGDLRDAVARLTPTETERDSLQRQVQWLMEEQQRLRVQVAAQKTQLRRKVQSAGKARRHADEEREPERSGAFSDPTRQLEHEVYLEWAERIHPEEKESHPLLQWTVGPEFHQSIATTDPALRRTIIRVIVEVLTGIAEHSAGRELHRLRSGTGGDDPPVVRSDGATCWRVAVQRNTPSARRLHYWRSGDHIELGRVVLHDDVRR